MRPDFNAGMNKRPFRPIPKKRQFRRTYIREWRKHRNKTLEQLAEAMDMTASHFSMLERGQRGYTQETLEAIADALQTDAASLLMRNPADPDAMWSLWDQAKQAERDDTVKYLEFRVKSRTAS
jgi:transcriptional regulator with XRE-family HTH domain